MFTSDGGIGKDGYVDSLPGLKVREAVAPAAAPEKPVTGRLGGLNVAGDRC